MVNYGILSAALKLPSINLEVRVSVELRELNGSFYLDGTTDEVVIAKIETVKAVAELMHFEYSKELAEGKRDVAEIARSVLKHARPVAVRNDQLTFDLFNEAIRTRSIEAAPYFGETQQ